MKILSRTPSASEPPAKEIDKPKTIQRSIEITVEREFLAMVNQPGAAFIALCAVCGKDVLLLSPDAAALTAGTSPREVYRWLEAGQLHFQELPNGKVYLCSESLKSFERPGPQSPEQLSSGESL
jgi:hypothetical protein